ncbi:uridine kinase family protein [Ktedonospora formicarum]|uniref:Uridine kinase n=1 Tax=Ktedonospora formicarum TaxID=2778364 RepID=A0A8J3MW12_9CHLR|nr:hypothetical protein [Ktedonospora formicarum]GHO50937.1 uridine kinase [Ktedonospora formicarum]
MKEIQRNQQSAPGAILLDIHQLLRHKNPVLVALDGRSGTGKSTIANELAKHGDGVVVVGDDFYSGGDDDVWSGISAEEKVAKVIDWQRMRKQVLEPLLAKRPAHWHPLDFHPERGWVGWKDETITLEPAPVILLDGAYSARPELADLVDLAILVEVNDITRRERLILREGPDFMSRWHRLWDPAEDLYFTYIRPRSSFDIVVSNEA